MIQIELHRNFIKSYDKRIKSNSKLLSQVKKRIELFQVKPEDYLLKDHPLIGQKKNLRAFSVSGDIRIIYYYLSANKVIFFDIGSHNQVY